MRHTSKGLDRGRGIHPGGHVQSGPRSSHSRRQRHRTRCLRQQADLDSCRQCVSVLETRLTISSPCGKKLKLNDVSLPAPIRVVRTVARFAARTPRPLKIASPGLERKSVQPPVSRSASQEGGQCKIDSPGVHLGRSNWDA